VGKASGYSPGAIEFVLSMAVRMKVATRATTACHLV
jgi:hypothetical protein